MSLYYDNDMMLYDISVPLSNTLCTWPGDPGLVIEKRLDLCCGDVATVSALSMGVHTGTHVDAFSHFLKDGQTLDQMSLERYIGKALVLAIQNPVAITVDDLKPFEAELRQAERVIFKTVNSSVKWYEKPFNEQFCHLSPKAAEYLVQCGIQLVGIDYLSVESFNATALYPEACQITNNQAPTHQILMQAGLYIVEGLYLGEVNLPAGFSWFELTCLPVHITGVDGSPARVVLRDGH